MNKISPFKKIFIIAIIISFVFACKSHTSMIQNLDDLAYIMAIGVDVGTTAKYKISLQLSTIESSASEAVTQSSSGGGSSGGSSGGGRWSIRGLI